MTEIKKKNKKKRPKVEKEWEFCDFQEDTVERADQICELDIFEGERKFRATCEWEANKWSKGEVMEAPVGQIS